MNLMQKTNKLPVLVLLSGGIDSTACTHFYREQQHAVSALFVDYGQPAKLSERKSAQAIATHYGMPLQQLSVSGVTVPASGEITGRNALLLSAALMAIGKKAALITLGIHAGTRYFDCQPGFVRHWEELLSGYTDGRVQLGIPFLRWKKAAIWQYCTEQKVPVQLTWSCEASDTTPCGSCLSCKDKENLLARA